MGSKGPLRIWGPPDGSDPPEAYIPLPLRKRPEADEEVEEIDLLKALQDSINRWKEKNVNG